MIPRVVIVGAGFGGLAAARALRKARAEIVLIDRTNHHLFQPLLYQVATSVLGPSQIGFGESNALRLGERLSGLAFAKVFTSPLVRARRTCELAGFGSVAKIDGDLLECDYGEYEGRLTVDILKERPDWQLFRDGCPGGESSHQVAARADRVVSRLRAINGDVLIFSSGCWLRNGSASSQSMENLSCWARRA